MGYETIGRSVDKMKSKLKKAGGKYLGQDLEWWKEKTKPIFDESILDFSADADAKALVIKFSSICNATTEERQRRTRQGKNDKNRNYGNVEMTRDGKKIKTIPQTTEYYFGP